MPGGLMQLVGYGSYDRLMASEVNCENNVKWKYVNKIINLTKNNECPISFIKFESGCKYCVCTTCKYNINADILEKCFAEGNECCPMCRSEWTDFTIYINNFDNDLSDESSNSS